MATSSTTEREGTVASAAGSASVPEARPSQHRVVIKPTHGWASLRLREVWNFRELLLFLVERDLKIRYRQTALGVIWVVLQPLALALVITLFFGLVVKVPHEGVPYPIFVFSAMVPWTLFSQSLVAASTSLIVGSNMISKVYFPRLVLPIAAAGSFLVDFLVGLVFLGAMMLYYGSSPTIGVLLLPFFGALALASSLSIGIWLSALNVRYRDVQSGVPLLVQLWLFATPIAYPLSLVPASLHTVYALNPMVTVVTGFRWALLGSPAPSPALAAVSLGATAILFVLGVAYFRRTERTFADVI
jgi:lipopolysaccharide transport system permease protein